MPGFALRYPQTLSIPLQIIQSQSGDLPAAQSISYQQQKDRVITFAHRDATIHHLQHPSNLTPGNGARNRGQTIALGSVDAGTKVTRNDPFPMQIDQKHPQGQTQPRDGTFSPWLATNGYEAAQNGRRNFL